MFGFKNAQQKRIDADALIIAALTADKADLTAEIKQLKEDKRGLDATAAVYRQRADIAGRQKAHLEAENHRLTAQLQPFLDRRAKAKLNLKQFRKPTNGAAAQAVVG